MKLAQAQQVAIAVTRVYEGGGVTWDFDGAGLSLGLLQWNLGAGTLQPMLRQFLLSPEAREIIPFAQASSLASMLEAPQSVQMAWAKGINDYDNKVLHQPWGALFGAIVRSKSWKVLEDKASSPYLATALEDMKWSGVHTTRSYCMFFDLAVQNGGMGTVLKLALSAAKPFLKSYVRDAKVKNTDSDKAWLIACAGSRALLSYMSNPVFAMNVFKRKLGICEGGYSWRKGELPQVNSQVNFEAAEYGVSDDLIEDL